MVFGETPAGAVDGSNATFTTSYAFKPESVQLYVNGVLERHFVTSGSNTLLLSESPTTGEVLRVNYERT